MNTEQNSINLKDKNKLTTKKIIIAGMFTAIIVVLAQITIPTTPVPFTLSLLAIFLTGALLSPRLALLSVAAYILLGIFGLPVFANSRGGVSVLFDKTGGYIMAYPLMAFVTSLFYHFIRRFKTVALVVGMFFSLILCYGIGTLWFSHVTGIDFFHALTLCVYPFVFFDVIKIVLATSFSMILRKTAFRHMGLI
ncbi:biotin transporter BioY [Mobilitalea sibirica]|uniref:Biotin transporter n=1 Tax=Mobilitalea sibirica TaxID=1462919 RepID=A0A8J7H2W6_9FIRM|nr:biotin transporter BioY [Mobilitalea sibirica]MBH1940995.1 biotin transporter BioY [Mobilitalea sibirica]